MTDEPLVDAVAAALWKAEATDAGCPPSIPARRTPAAFMELRDSDKARWRKFARAAIKEVLDHVEYEDFSSALGQSLSGDGV